MSAPKEQLPGLLKEFSYQEQQRAIVGYVIDVLMRTTVTGEDAEDLGRAIYWARSVIDQITKRIAEIRTQLPAESGEIKMGPEAPEPADAVEAPMPTGVGGMEISKGSPIIIPAR